MTVLLMMQFMLILDVSVVNIALPTLNRDLDFSRGELTWVVDAYVLMAGGLLLLGGRLGDVFGRRRVFTVGAAVFGLASLACALAPNAHALVAARFVQGTGEALAGPAAFGLIAVMFTDSKERAKAIGLFGGISGVGGTSGPIIGGALVAASWRWIFLINLPVVAIVLLAVPRVIAGGYDSRDEGVGRRVDLLGALLVTGGCLSVVYGAIEAATAGWGSAKVIAFLALGVVLLIGFVSWQRVATSPLMPLRFFDDRTRIAGNVVTVVFYSVFFTQFFITTLYLQNVRGYSALKAGLAFLPFGVTLGVAIGLATALQPRIGAKPILLSGVALSGLAMVLFARITATGSFLGQVLPASLVIAFGSGLCLPSLSNAAVHNVTERDAGLAAGLQQALQQIGGAVGLAALITISIRSTTHDIDRGASPADATTNGYVLAFHVAALVLLAALVLTAVLMQNDTRAVRSGESSPRYADRR